jgi:hypothetical protein
MVSVQLVVAVCVMAPRFATGSSPDWNCAWSSISWRSNMSRQSSAPDIPVPRRSTATIGCVLRTSPPARDSQTGSCSDDGRSDPVVITSGPASSGVCGPFARTTPMLTVPVAPLIGSSSAS